jgi:hypothetical protein
MPSSHESTPTSPPPAWTVARAQAALGDAACQVLAAVDLLEEVYRSLPPPDDLADRQEGRKAYDVATDVLATIECVLEDDLRPAIQTLQRSSQVTDTELRASSKSGGGAYEPRRRHLLFTDCRGMRSLVLS